MFSYNLKRPGKKLWWFVEMHRGGIFCDNLNAHRGDEQIVSGRRPRKARDEASAMNRDEKEVGVVWVERPVR